MSPETTLGGFKVLNDVEWITIVQPEIHEDCPAGLCRILAGEGINLNFLSCGMAGDSCGMNLVVVRENAHKVIKSARENYNGLKINSTEGSVLSLFPHKCDPRITSYLLEVLNDSGPSDFALANSYSAISSILPKERIEEITKGLFGPFSFSAFRTPADWRLAQKGKEALFKEVVASYQEKKPKVYILQWDDELELIRLKLDDGAMPAVQNLFNEIGKLGISLSFLITTPSLLMPQKNLFLSLPQSKKNSYTDILDSLPAGILAERISPVAYFTMNGPHFGDRYGIASELLWAFKSGGVEVIGLSCSVASVSGIVPASQAGKCIQIIQECFEVPSVIRLGL